MLAPTKEDMENFAELIQKLGAIDRGRVVLLIDDMCRTSLRKPDQNELEICIDAMDKKTFLTLTAFMETCIADEKKKKGAKRKRPRS